MLPQISKITELKENISTATLFEKLNTDTFLFLTENETVFLKEKLNYEKECAIYRHPNILYFSKIKSKGKQNNLFEDARKAGSVFFELLKKEKITAFQIAGFCQNPVTLAFL